MQHCYPVLNFTYFKTKLQRFNLLRLVLVFFLPLLVSASLHAQTWTQLGIDIDGEANDDYSGYSVSFSADGSIVAIGAYANAGSGSSSSYRGHVRVYKNISGTWTQQGADIDGEADGDYSGWSVSLSADGSIVAIGAYSNAGGRGQVRVYKNISGSWIKQGGDIDGEADGDQLGWSVSLSADGNTVAIGAPQNIGGGIQRGHVRVYKNISGIWTQQGADIDGEANNNQSGWSVSLSTDGTIVAIGTPSNAGGGTQFAERGHVRVYKNISGTWTQQGADIDGEADGDRSGFSISLSADGSIVAIGAYLNVGGGTSTTQRGHVRVYKNMSGTWTQQGLDIDGEADSGGSGWSVSLSANGSTVAIGTPFSAGGGSYRGHVRVYKNTSDTWTQQGLDIDGEANGDQSGRSVSLSSDGSKLAIGTHFNAGEGSYRGHVRVYKYSGGCTTPSSFVVTGGGSYCQGGKGAAIGLSGSQVDVMYQLKNGTSAVGSPVSGTGSKISFGLKTALGTYTVEATSTTGGCTATMTGSVSISITYPFSALASSVACSGGSLQLSTTFIPLGAHKWQGPAGFSSNLAKPAVKNMSQAKAGVYTVSVTYNNCISLASVNVSVPAPQTAWASSNSPVCVGSSIRLTANTVGESYQWKGPKSFNSSLKTPNIAATNTAQRGIYSLTVIGSTGCYSTATISVVVQACGGTRIASEESEDMEMEVSTYPNPTSKLLTVEVTLKEPSSLKLNLYNATGNTLTEWNLSEETTTHRKKIDMSFYKDGLYLIQAQSKDGKQSKRVVKME